MRHVSIIFTVLLGLASCPLQAHDLQYSVAHGKAVLIRLTYPDGTGFSYESYEVFREGEDIPFQVGRTDAGGSIVFAPDRSGTWRVKTFSEDGHGIDFAVEVDEDLVSRRADRPFIDRYARIITGIALIFGIFGLVNLFVGRKRR